MAQALETTRTPDLDEITHTVIDSSVRVVAEHIHARFGGAEDLAASDLFMAELDASLATYAALGSTPMNVLSDSACAERFAIEGLYAAWANAFGDLDGDPEDKARTRQQGVRSFLSYVGKVGLSSWDQMMLLDDFSGTLAYPGPLHVRSDRLKSRIDGIQLQWSNRWFRTPAEPSAT